MVHQDQIPFYLNIRKEQTFQIENLIKVGESSLNEKKKFTETWLSHFSISYAWKHVCVGMNLLWIFPLWEISWPFFVVSILVPVNWLGSRWISDNEAHDRNLSSGWKKKHDR